MPHWYKLDEHKRPVPCNFQEAQQALAGHKNVQKITVLQFATPFFNEEVCISTVFLALDHSLGDGEPVLFETLVIGGVNDGYQERYTSHALAMAGHQRITEQQHMDNSFWRLLLKRIKKAWKRRKELL